ncbi:excinuclease ABC subunit UvrC [Flavobacteriales bacterium]|jgi:excinuclease ABC subunit C|nr:excinuclease ABC subunit UvrC [Flavobacteriales bacterium]|tara:strand:+ start:2715 stop:4445 length:1731 start_codon:yes stop_codon:yes gene_type:complete
MDYKEHLKSAIKRLPSTPGVYNYYDDIGKIIYIGKAKNLKRRVSSYFTKNHDNLKTKILVSKIYDFKYILVETEIDALLLENNLIKKHQPKYNILLKDDKSYPWICIKKEEFPRVFQTRKVIKDGSEYFGPYMSTYVVNVLLNFFSEIFYDNGWTPFTYLGKEKKPESKEKYLETISQIRKILKGDIKSVISYLKDKMMMHADKMEFENAQKIKEQLNLLTNYQSKSSIVSSKINNVDVFTIISDEKNAFVNYLKITTGAIIQSHTVEIKKKLSESDEEILQFVITDLRIRFNSVSTFIYSSNKIINIWGKVKIIIPAQGEKKKLIDLSLRNAKYMQLEKKKRQALNLTKSNKSIVLQKIKQDLHLKETPIHIECFDNSNFQGSNPTASCVVFKKGVPSKKDYRHYNIKTVVGPDDYASMEEIVLRRYRRLLKEKKSLPQLIVIDGGKGQLSSAIKSLKELKVYGKIAIIGIAKRLEEIYFPNDNTPIYLDKRSSSLKLIQQLRNEAHRFAINHHRKKRSLNSISSELEKINGIGPKTVDKIIQNYGSFENLMKSKRSEIVKLIGKEKTNKLFSKE